VRQYYKHQGCRGHYTNMHVGMFTKRASPNANYPKMRGRACEIKMLGSALLDVWSHYCDAGSVVQSQIKLLLTYSVSMEKVLSDTAGSNYLEPAVFAPFMECCERFLVVYSSVHQNFESVGMRQFNITPKLHLLWHACWGAQWLHPRLTWCYSGFPLKSASLQTCCKVAQATLATVQSCFAPIAGFTGEDYMLHSRRMAQGCLRGSPKWHAVNKMAAKWTRGFTFRMQSAARGSKASSS
jgi:hypothetical protein